MHLDNLNFLGRVKSPLVNNSHANLKIRVEIKIRDEIEKVCMILQRTQKKYPNKTKPKPLAASIDKQRNVVITFGTKVNAKFESLTREGGKYE